MSLPMISGAAEAELDVCDRSMCVSVPGRSKLTLALPARVDAGSVRARWRKASSQLLVTVPKALEQPVHR